MGVYVTLLLERCTRYYTKHSLLQFFSLDLDQLPPQLCWAVCLAVCVVACYSVLQSFGGAGGHYYSKKTDGKRWASQWMASCCNSIDYHPFMSLFFPLNRRCDCYTHIPPSFCFSLYSLALLLNREILIFNFLNVNHVPLTEIMPAIKEHSVFFLKYIFFKDNIFAAFVTLEGNRT